MAKFYGYVGYVRTVETSPGIWEEVAEERRYSGDITRNTRRWDRSDYLNDDLTINNTISIVSDRFASENIFAMRYVKWMGSCWKITNVEVARPRLILTLGGVYNGPETETSGDSGTDTDV